MKKLVLLIFAIVVNVINANAQQMLNYGAITTITPNVFVCVEGNLINNAGGTIKNNGNILLSGNYVNNSNFVSGSNSYVKLTGAAQDVGGSVTTTFEKIIIGGTADKTISIPTNVNDSLIFNANHVLINNNNLTLFKNAVHSGTSNSKFVITNGTGSLVKKAVASNIDFLFPVGDAVTSYKPVTLNNAGIVDTFAVRVAPGVTPTTGTDASCVQYTYFVEESNPGGSNASLSLGWNTTDEGTLFHRDTAYIWQYKNNTWNLLPGTAGAFNNQPLTNWYHKTLGITDFSASANKFIVRSYSKVTLISQTNSKSICQNNKDTVTFSVTATGYGIQYQWQENCGSGWTNLIDNTTYSGTKTNELAINDPGLGMSGCQYQCIMENLMDTVISQPVVLTVNSMPHAYAGLDTTTYIGNSIQLDVSGGISYHWIPPTYLDNPDIPDPTATPLNNISYIVFITNKYGCTTSDTINIFVNTESTEIFVPTAFAPDGPQINKVLYVRGNGIKDIEFVVYDRWGEKVFETNDIHQGWDGTFKGAHLSTAVFVYYVKATYFNGDKVEKKGNVTLIR